MAAAAPIAATTGPPMIRPAAPPIIPAVNSTVSSLIATRLPPVEAGAAAGAGAAYSSSDMKVVTAGRTKALD